MHAPASTLIGYSTQPGNVALDGSAGYSPYAIALHRAIRDPGPHGLVEGNRPEQGVVVTVLAAGKIVGVFPCRSVRGQTRVDAAFQGVMNLGVGEDDFSRGLLNVATLQAVHGQGVGVWNGLDVGVAARATDPCMRAAAEEALVDIEQAIVAISVHTTEPAKTMAHQTVFRIGSHPDRARDEMQQNDQPQPQERPARGSCDALFAFYFQW